MNYKLKEKRNEDNISFLKKMSLKLHDPMIKRLVYMFIISPFIYMIGDNKIDKSSRIHFVNIALLISLYHTIQIIKIYSFERRYDLSVFNYKYRP